MLKNDQREEKNKQKTTSKESHLSTNSLEDEWKEESLQEEYVTTNFDFLDLDNLD